LKVIAARRDAVSVADGDHGQAQQKGDENNEQDRMMKGPTR
jgi:hypothetical protein